MKKRAQCRGLAAVVAVAALGVAACGDDDAAAPASTTAAATAPAETSRPPDTTAAGSGLVEVEHQYGATEVPEDPTRIVSASVTMTGPLLAVGAPVVGSAAAPGGSKLTDGNGFFVQWAEEAASAGVEPMAGQLNIEAVAALEPDLIVGSAFGGDAVTEDTYRLLSEIAPTVVIDHSKLNVGELTTAVGEATGRRDEAADVTASLEERIAEVAPTLDTSKPVAPVSIADNGGLNVLTPVSAHGQLLASLGYRIQEVDATADSELAGSGARQDVVSLSAETLSEQLGDSSLFFIFAEQAEVDAATAAIPTLAALPAFQEGRAFPLGYDSFRLDPFSARDVIDAIATFGT